MRRLVPPRRFLVGCALTLLVSLLTVASAFGADRVYWGNYSDGISFANLDGSGGGGDLNTTGVTPAIPWGVAYDPVTGRIYWANYGNNQIQFANADGSGGAGQLNPGTADVNFPSGVAIDPATRKIYWGNQGANDISYESLDTPANNGQLNITGSHPAQPTGLAINPDNGLLYWTNLVNDTISYAKLDGSGGGGELTITGTTISGGPSGIAIDLSAGRLYWANRFRNTNGTIGYANLDGSNGGELNTTGASMHLPDGVAIDAAAGKLYWANLSSNTISYANLDGSGAGDVGTAGATTNGPQFPILIETPKTIQVPTISGDATPGSTLTCSSVTWGGDMPWAFLWRAPLSFGYQWTRDGNDIAGATQSSWTALQAGSYTCREIAANEVGTSSVTSAPHAIIAPSPANTTTNTTTPTTTPTTSNTTGTSPSPTKPVLIKVSESHRRWREGKGLPHIAAGRVPVGTVFRFTLNENAPVGFTFTQGLHGRTVTRGTVPLAGHSGLNKVSFQGRLSRTRKLKPGTYTLTITATNAAGNARARLTFTIVQ